MNPSLADISEVFAKFVLAIILSGLVGMERERKGRAAGLRTHIMVCLGATLITVVSHTITEQLAQVNPQRIYDSSRVAAGVITGVGFLGAGAIIHMGLISRGLTTAALIWFVAALGVAVGEGLYSTAVLATALALVVVIGLQYFGGRFSAHEVLRVTIQSSQGMETLMHAQEIIKDEGYKVTVSRVKISNDGMLDVNLSCHFATKDKPHAEKLLDRLRTELSASASVGYERLEVL
ncbi:MAG: MgtC/SapB family protein [Candidatus Hydrogenedentes bacterium]|nr:MgtC/SapB family protein [Candidatus Hydrogenedentota bacterium]